MHTKSAAGGLQRERELKLRFRPDDLALLEASALILAPSREGEPGAEVHHLESVYFDTPDLDLARHGLELRVRRDAENEWVQTIKARWAARGSGFFDRAEHECPVAGLALDLDQLPKGLGFGWLRRKRIRSRLRPVFATRVERRIYHLAGCAGGEIELAIDVGKVSAGRRTTPLCEVELEAKGEEPDILFRLAEALSESVDLRPETRGKADLGYALLRSVGARPEKGSPVRMRLNSAKEEVFAEILETALRQIRSNERAILASEDPEGVHQMRVALRRLRACLSIFRDELPREAVEPVRESLRGILAVLGPARDADVLLANKLSPAKPGAGGDPVFAGILALAEKDRAKAWAQVRKLLASRDYSRTILRLTGWIACRRWRAGMTGKELRRFQQPVGDMAETALEKGHRRLLGVGENLARADDAEWHHLRIAIKKQRYFIESFQDCFSAKSMGHYTEALASLQDRLGALQDLSIAETTFAKMARGQPEPVTAFLRATVLWQARERAWLRESVVQLWAEFAELNRPWHDRR